MFICNVRECIKSYKMVEVFHGNVCKVLNGKWCHLWGCVLSCVVAATGHRSFMRGGSCVCGHVVYYAVWVLLSHASNFRTTPMKRNAYKPMAPFTIGWRAAPRPPPSPPHVTTTSALDAKSTFSTLHRKAVPNAMRDGSIVVAQFCPTSAPSENAQRFP